MSLSKLLSAQEIRLRAVLEESRSTYRHMGLRGDQTESAVRSFLAGSIPRKLTVGRGEIVDINGVRSAESDVVIANEDQPFRYPESEPGLYIVEGVSAVGEVKSKLTVEGLDDVLRKGRALKSLKSSTANLDLSDVPASDVNRFYACPPLFLLAFESVVSQETLNRRIFDSIPRPKDGVRAVRAPLDAIFVLGQGFGIDYGDGDGRLGLQLVPDGISVGATRDWCWINSDVVLLGMLMWLNSVTARKHLMKAPPALEYFTRELEEGHRRDMMAPGPKFRMSRYQYARPNDFEID
jgi:hypothetical protein